MGDKNLRHKEPTSCSYKGNFDCTRVYIRTKREERITCRTMIFKERIDTEETLPLNNSKEFNDPKKVFKDISTDLWSDQISPICLVWDSGDLLDFFSRRRAYDVQRTTIDVVRQGYRCLKSGRVEKISFFEVDSNCNLVDEGGRPLYGLVCVKSKVTPP